MVVRVGDNFAWVKAIVELLEFERESFPGLTLLTREGDVL
jgi:hypothetical protein